MLSAYQRHWLNYQLGAKFLNNLFGYFNRVSLKKYQINEETTDYALPAILQPPVAPPPPGTPVEIRNVCGVQLASSRGHSQLFNVPRLPFFSAQH